MTDIPGILRISKVMRGVSKGSLARRPAGQMHHADRDVSPIAYEVAYR